MANTPAGGTGKPPRSNAPKSSGSVVSRPSPNRESSPSSVAAEARVIQSSTVTYVGPINTMALVGFILSIAAVFVSVTAIPGVILSHVGMKQIKEKGEPGRGFALAGIIVGYCVIGLWALVVVILVLYFIFFFLLFGGLMAVSSPYLRIS